MTSIYQRNHFNGKAFALIAAVCLFFSCAKSENDYSMSNQEFVTQASSSNNFEVAAGALAQSKGQNQAVKHYGEHMVTDHTKAAMEMKALAGRKNLIILQLGELSPTHRQNLDILVNATAGTDFDRKFAQLMVQSHQEAVSLFETASKTYGVPDPELRAMAEQKLPTLRAHLQDATTLRTTVGA